MQFLAIVYYSHGNKMTHEFRSPLERAVFVRGIRKSDPKAKVRLKNKGEMDELVPADPNEREWYGE